MPGSWSSRTPSGEGSPSRFTQRTRPRMDSGSLRRGIVSLKMNSVPTSSGLRVRMKVPPLQMFFV